MQAMQRCTWVNIEADELFLEEQRQAMHAMQAMQRCKWMQAVQRCNAIQPCVLIICACRSVDHLQE